MSNNINDAVIDHLSMKTSGALLITGDWDSGKTYYIKNKLLPLIEAKTDDTTIIVSMYGEKSRTELAQKILFTFFDKKGAKSKLSTGTIVKNFKNIAEAIPKIKGYVNVEKLISGTGENVFKLLPHDKLLICFDDVERIGEGFQITDFIGMVNEQTPKPPSPPPPQCSKPVSPWRIRRDLSTNIQEPLKSVILKALVFLGLKVLWCYRRFSNFSHKHLSLLYI